ncbi:MAG: hypothetical protein JSS66_14080 [Armatimonadetes bacterium]|nr:hypothetical protein [Armatimonadota bacterium]
MNAEYFVTKPNGERTGPFDEDAMATMVKSGAVAPEDRIEDGQGGTYERSVFVPAGTNLPVKKLSPWVWVAIGAAALCLPCGAVLAAVLFPVFAQARVAAKQSSTLNELTYVGIAVQSYTVDHDDKFPPAMATLDEAWPSIGGYAKSPMPQSYNDASPKFLGNQELSAKAIKEIQDPRRTYMFFDAAPWMTGSRCVVFADSHASRVTEVRINTSIANHLVDTEEP